MHLPFNSACQLTSGVEVFTCGKMSVDQTVLELGAFQISNFQRERVLSWTCFFINMHRGGEDDKQIHGMAFS